MADLTSKLKGAVGKATAAVKDFAQETTDMKDKPDEEPSQQESASYEIAQDPLPDDERYADVSVFDMAPVSESQVSQASQAAPKSRLNVHAN